MHLPGSFLGSVATCLQRILRREIPNTRIHNQTRRCTEVPGTVQGCSCLPASVRTGGIRPICKMCEGSCDVLAVLQIVRLEELSVYGPCGLEWRSRGSAAFTTRTRSCILLGRSCINLKCGRELTADRLHCFGASSYRSRYLPDSSLLLLLRPDLVHPVSLVLFSPTWSRSL